MVDGRTYRSPARYGLGRVLFGGQLRTGVEHLIVGPPVKGEQRTIVVLHDFLLGRDGFDSNAAGRTKLSYSRAPCNDYLPRETGMAGSSFPCGLRNSSWVCAPRR